MTAAAWSRACLGGAWLTLPWIGLGTLRLLTGRDLGAGLQPSWLLLGVASVLVVVGHPRVRPDLPRPVRRWALAAAVALALSALGLLVAPVAEPAAVVWQRYGKQVIQLGIMAAFLGWPALWVRGAARWRWTARLLVAGALLQVLYGGLQWLHWYQPGALLPALDRVFTSNPAILSGSEQLHLADGFRDVPRLRGTASEPLYLGNYLLLILPLLGLTGWRRGFKLGAGLVLWLLLLLTWSRGAWLAALAGGVLALGLRRWSPVTGGPDRRPRWRLWVGCAAVAVVLAALLGPERLLLPVERLAQSVSGRDWSNLTRLYSMQAAWRAFTLSPLVGVGWGQFAWHFPLLVDTAGLQSQFQWPVVNNFPLQILCETGIVGFAVFAAISFALVRATGRALREPGDGARVQRVCAAAVATFAVWLQLLTFSQYNLPHIWVAPGLLLAALADRGGADNERTEA